MLRLQSVIRDDGWGTCMVALWHMIDDLALDVAKNCGKQYHIPYRCINRNSLSSFVRHCMVCATCCKQHVYAADKDDDGVDNKAGDGADDGADEWKIDIYLLRLPCLFIDMDISNTTASQSLSLSLHLSCLLPMPAVYRHQTTCFHQQHHQFRLPLQPPLLLCCSNRKVILQLQLCSCWLYCVCLTFCAL